MKFYIGVSMLLVIFILLTYAVYLLKQLWRQHRRRKIEEVLAQKKSEARRLENQLSIEIIIKCLLQEQVSLTEASIRISALVKTLKLNASEAQDYAVFDKLALATAHIPILADWQKLTTKQRYKFSAERETIETKYRQEILAEASVILRKIK